MKFQNNKAKTLNGKQLQRAITPTTFHLIGSKFNQVISSSVQISISNIKALAQILFELSCYRDFNVVLFKGK